MAKTLVGVHTYTHGNLINKKASIKNAKGKWKPKPHLKSYQKVKRKLKQLTCRRISISLDERIKQINYVVRGWVNYFRIANI